ncbi:MAG: PadR family transcriptional regulator [Streptosporangiales bacterium]|nr:PadR family transcriptional regulator [Streptosporangiales bacterium]
MDTTPGAGPDRPDPPMTPASFRVLLALAGGPAHGYAVMRFVGRLSEGTVRLGPGTLYRTLQRLRADGLVEEVGGNDPTAPHDARRRYYRLTPAGRRAAETEARLLARTLRAAVERGLIAPEEGQGR